MKLVIMKELIRLLELDVVKIATQFKAVSDNPERTTDQIDAVVMRSVVMTEQMKSK